MQREIKFRVWDRLKNQYDSWWEDGDYYGPNEYWGNDPSCFRSALEKTLNNENYVVQQFTGLKDKNDKEIYEGDLLKISHEDRCDYFEDYCHVWYSSSGSFVVSFNHLYSETSCDLYMVNFKYEIIGNIFENPELLNGNA